MMGKLAAGGGQFRWRRWADGWCFAFTFNIRYLQGKLPDFDRFPAVPQFVILLAVASEALK